MIFISLQLLLGEESGEVRAPSRGNHIRHILQYNVSGFKGVISPAIFVLMYGIGGIRNVSTVIDHDFGLRSRSFLQHVQLLQWLHDKQQQHGDTIHLKIAIYFTGAKANIRRSCKHLP